MGQIHYRQSLAVSRRIFALRTCQRTVPLTGEAVGSLGGLLHGDIRLRAPTDGHALFLLSCAL
jgi:hypothetical protein